MADLFESLLQNAIRTDNECIQLALALWRDRVETQSLPRAARLAREILGDFREFSEEINRLAVIGRYRRRFPPTITLSFF